MKVTFLGTSAAVPSARHNNVCFVAHAREPVLFECGPSILYQLAVAGIDPGDLRTAIVSHIHGDHSLGLPMLLMANYISQRRQPLTICLPESAVDPIKQVCLTVYPSMSAFIDSTVEWLPLPEKKSGTFMLAGQARATTTRAEHSVPVVSTRVNFERERCDLAFSGDTAYCEGVGHNAAAVDLLVHESNWSLALKTDTGRGHSTAAEAGKIASLAKAKRLALVHTSRELAGHEPEIAAEASREFVGEVIAPIDFTSIEI